MKSKKELSDVIDCLKVLSNNLDSLEGSMKNESEHRKDAVTMAEDRKEEMEEKKDADMHVSGTEGAKKFEPEDMLGCLDSVMKRLDSMSSKLDEFGEFMKKEKKDRKDDGEPLGTDAEVKSAMNAQIKRDSDEEDEDEEDEYGEDKKKKEEEFVAKDKKKRKDGEMPEAFKKKMEEKKDRRDADDEDEKEHKKDDQINALLKAVAQQAKTIDKLQKQMEPVSDVDYHKLSAAHHRADAVYAAHSLNAPRPYGAGEDVVAYRRRLLTPMKKYHETWKGVDLNAVSDDVFAIAENDVYKAAMDASMSPADLSPGQFRPIQEINPVTGARSTRFVGNGTIFGAMKPAMRRVVNFKTGSSNGA